MTEAVQIGQYTIRRASGRKPWTIWLKIRRVRAAGILFAVIIQAVIGGDA